MYFLKRSILLYRVFSILQDVGEMAYKATEQKKIELLYL